MWKCLSAKDMKLVILRRAHTFILVIKSGEIERKATKVGISDIRISCFSLREDEAASQNFCLSL